MKNLDNACGYFQRYYHRPHEDGDPRKPQLYWDGYQWVIRPNSLSQQNFDVIKPGRKVIFSNVPLHINILVKDFRTFIIDKVLEKNVVSRKEVREINDIIRGIELDYENNTAVVAMESTDIAKRMILLDGIILLGYTLRVSLYQDINSEDNICQNITKASALANSAHLSAKSAAIAFAAFKSISKNDSMELNLGTDIKSVLPSTRIIKAYGFIPDVTKVKSDKFNNILEDMKEEFGKFGKILSAIIIKPKMDKIGAEVGSVFVEYDDSRASEICKKALKGRRYEGKTLKLAFIEDHVYKNEIL
jgi:splicing factor U2AF subunit